MSSRLDLDKSVLAGKTILVGVTGGIAAYKSITLVSMLMKKGAQVQVALTESALQFVTPLPFQSLSKQPVITSLFEEPNPSEIAHISWVDRADLVVIAPATANFLAKVANGFSDDFLTAALLANQAPVLLVPAMNVNMWHHKAVRRNVRICRELGYEVMAPASGLLACGWVGDGRMPEPEEIVEKIEERLQSDTDRPATPERDYQGMRVLVTAGATREHLDPVRVLTNPSTGKMGFSVAQAAVERGAEVTLICGPTQVQPPEGCSVISVTSALDMEKAVLDQLPQHDVLLMAAAVSDWRPLHYFSQKVKKTDGPMTVEFVRNPDILVSVSEHRTNRQVIAGFAAETENVIQHATEKLHRKRLDLMFANDVSQEGSGFETDTNQMIVIRPNADPKELPLTSKLETGHLILNEVLPLLRQRIQA